MVQLTNRLALSRKQLLPTALKANIIDTSLPHDYTMEMKRFPFY